MRALFREAEDYEYSWSYRKFPPSFISYVFTTLSCEKSILLYRYTLIVHLRIKPSRENLNGGLYHEIKKHE